MPKYFILILLLISCGKKYTPKNFENPKITQLKIKHKKYLMLSKKHTDEMGWVLDTKCDGLLFNSLYAVAGGQAKIEAAYDGKGKWFRHHTKNCYPNSSASTISRDMFAGLYIWILVNKKSNLINEIIAHGESNINRLGGWVMGEGDQHRISIRGAGQANAYNIRYALTKVSHIKRKIKNIYGRSEEYQAHLQVLDIYLRYLLTNKLSNYEFKTLKRHAQREPNNSLFNAVYGKFVGDKDSAINTLLNESLFPANRLPSSDDRCEPYLWQRNQYRNGQVNPDWLPCSEKGGDTHNGVDFLFASYIILN